MKTKDTDFCAQFSSPFIARCTANIRSRHAINRQLRIVKEPYFIKTNMLAPYITSNKSINEFIFHWLNYRVHRKIETYL